MDLNLDVSGYVGSRAVCAVLKCEEDNSLKCASVHTRKSSAFKTITNITIFKILQGTSPGKDSNSRDLEVEVASVSRKQPKLSRVVHNIKMEGILARRRAVLTLTMVESTDCYADFACEVRGYDRSGKPSVIFRRIRQNSLQCPPGKEGGLTTHIPQPILDLLKELQTELVRTRETTERIESKVVTLERKLDTLTESTGRIESKTEAFEKILDESVKSYSASMDGFTERIESKVDTLENNLNGKLLIFKQIESNTEALSEQMFSLQNLIENRLEYLAGNELHEIYQAVMKFTNIAEASCKNVSKSISLEESFTTLWRNIKKELKEALESSNSALQNVLDTHNVAIDALLSTARNMESSQTTLRIQILKNIEEAFDKISENKIFICRDLTERYSSVGQDLIGSLQGVAADIKVSVVKYFDLARKFCNRKVITDTDYPTQCKRGSAGGWKHKPSPYHPIQPGDDSVVNFPFLCDMVTDGGGWIVIQRRSKGDVDFYRCWDDYKNGFGDFSGDFWLGNEKIHKITTSGPYELRVELVYKEESVYAQYDRFYIHDEESCYSLAVQGYSGTAGDSFQKNNGAKFTTLDRDNDVCVTNCAELHHGAWWYWSCSHSNLNGAWHGAKQKGPFWWALSRGDPVSFTEMKIRRL